MSRPIGWGWPGLARKAHYFVEGRALCNRWMYLGVVEDTNDNSADNCVVCKRAVEKQKGK